MRTRLKAACVQITSGPAMVTNLERAAELGHRACDAGAELLAFPENVSIMAQGSTPLGTRIRHETEHPALPAFAALARETGAWVLIGSLGIRLDDGRAVNRSYLLDDEGAVVAHYDKIHLFDVDLPGGERYRESDTYRPGNRAIVAKTPWGGIGLTVCYDVRFPALHRALAKAGADILTVPAAFTAATGAAHWHVLLRARAIETGSFVLAPAQTGTHEGGRRTFGHSLIVDPWGGVLADAGNDEGFVLADIDLAAVAEARRNLPTLACEPGFVVERVAKS